jgi:hypothetical protein
MSDATTERIIDLQNRLRIRLAELGFAGVQSTNVVHKLAEIAALAHGISADSVPLFLGLSPTHIDALVSVITQLKSELDEIRDAIQDIEPDFTEFMKFLQQR